MTRFRRTLRQTFTIARRDFTATVFTPIFLLFLFAPLIMGAFGAVGGLGAASVTDGAQDKAQIIAILPAAESRMMAEADTRLRGIFRPGEGPPDLTTQPAAAADPAAQARNAFDRNDIDAAAVLYGPLAAPQILYGPRGDRAAGYLATLAQTTLAAQQAGGTLPPIDVTKTRITRSRGSVGGQHQSAFFAVFGIFFLTLFLSGQVVGTMAEERNNKVIEVLAAAVPLESVFFGKLIGMFGVAVLFVAFWGTVVGQVTTLLPAGAGRRSPIAAPRSAGRCSRCSSRAISPWPICFWDQCFSASARRPRRCARSRCCRCRSRSFRSRCSVSRPPRSRAPAAGSRRSPSSSRSPRPSRWPGTRPIRPSSGRTSPPWPGRPCG
jgi:hypothetical protein